MKKKYRRYEPNQLLLLPQDMREWLPADHLAYFISDVVDELDISGIERVYEEELRGYPPFHPRMMLKLLVYGYCTGVRASRKIEKHVEEDVAFRVLAGGNMPKFRAIAEFRKRHLPQFENLFLQVFRICQRNGLVSLGHVSLDGTKIKANASKHKAMSYDRMKQEEERLRQEIKAMMREARRLDEEDDQQYGTDRRGDELPPELQRREERLKRIREAREALEKEAQEKQTAERKDHDDDQSEPPAPSAPAVPKGKSQRNFTDPESKIMPKGKAFIQGYNAQAIVDSKYQIIVANGVVNQTTDAPQLRNMVAKLIANADRKPDELSADAGYFSHDNIAFLEERSIKPYIPPDRQRHHQPVRRYRGPIPRDASPAYRMRRRLSTKHGRARYALRKVVVEPVFGQIKRIMGFDQFSFRGLEKNQAEWNLVCLCHDLIKLHRYCPEAV